MAQKLLPVSVFHFIVPCHRRGRKRKNLIHFLPDVFRDIWGQSIQTLKIMQTVTRIPQ